jgi:hypothetical protein
MEFKSVIYKTFSIDLNLFSVRQSFLEVAIILRLEVFFILIRECFVNNNDLKMNIKFSSFSQREFLA